MGTVAQKKFNSEKRIFHSRQDNSIVWNEPDITLRNGINITNTTGAGVTYNFVKTLDYIVVRWGIGQNENLIKKFENTNLISKSLEKNLDNNGNWDTQNQSWNNNFFYIPNVDDIEEMVISSTLPNVFAVFELITFNKPFVNLKKIDFGNSALNLFSNFTSFISNLPNLYFLRLRLANGNVPSAFNDLKNITSLKWLYITASPVLSEANAVNVFAQLPPNLYYLRFYMLGNYSFELSEFFTGKRIGLYLQPQNSLNSQTVTYAGGAVFPTILTEDSRYPIDYIVNQPSGIANKLNGDALSRFIVDFANQVNAVSINSAGKRIIFSGSTPNTSYTDNSQPLFKTYASALNHITTTLGITVTFT